MAQMEIDFTDQWEGFTIPAMCPWCAQNIKLIASGPYIGLHLNRQPCTQAERWTIFAERNYWMTQEELDEWLTMGYEEAV